MIKIYSSSCKRDNCTCQDSSSWEGDDLGIPLTGRKGVKGTDWSLFFPIMNWGHKRWYWVPELKGGTLSSGGCALAECFAKAWHRWKSWCESPWETASISDKKTQTTAGSENMLSWASANTRRVSGHHIHCLYSFPSTVKVNMKYCLDRPLLLSHMAIFMGISISPATFQLLLSAASGCFQQQESGVYEIPSFALKTYSEYRRSRDNLSAWGQEAKHYILASKQNEYLSWLLGKEGTGTSVWPQSHVSWSSTDWQGDDTDRCSGHLSRTACTAALKESVCRLQQHISHVLFVVYGMVFHMMVLS